MPRIPVDLPPPGPVGPERPKNAITRWVRDTVEGLAAARDEDEAEAARTAAVPEREGGGWSNVVDWLHEHADETELDPQEAGHLEAPVVAKANFWPLLLRQLHQGRQPDRIMREHADKDEETLGPVLEKLQQSISLLYVATRLISLHRHKDAAAIDRICRNHGIDTSDAGFLMQQRRWLTRSGSHHSGLENMVLAALAELPEVGSDLHGKIGKKLAARMRAREFSLKDLIEEVYEALHAEDHPHSRADLNAAILEMLETFWTTLRGREGHEAQTFLTALAEHMNAHANRHDKDHGAVSRGAIQHAFEEFAPDARIALEQMYALKGLTPERACRFLITPAGQQLARAMEIDLRQINNELLNAFIGGLVSSGLHARFMAQGVRLDDPNNVILFLLNEPLGRSLCEALKIDFTPFQTALRSSMESIPLHPEGRIDSYEKWLDQMVKNAGRPVAACGYGPLAREYDRNFQEFRMAMGDRWEAMNGAFARPHEHVDKDAAVERLYSELTANAPYNRVVKPLNRFADIVTDKLKIRAPDKRAPREQQERYQKQLAAMQVCSDAAATHPFLSQYFGGHHPVKDLQGLIKQHFAKTPDTPLIDLRQEMISNVLIPLGTALGTEIAQGATFATDRSGRYLSEGAFSQACNLKEALATLQVVRMEEPEAPHDTPAPAAPAATTDEAGISKVADHLREWEAKREAAKGQAAAAKASAAAPAAPPSPPASPKPAAKPPAKSGGGGHGHHH